MYTEPKFLAMKDKSKAKRMAELLRVIILQLGDDVPRAKREFETYAGWMNLPESERLTGKNQAQMIDLYKTFRTRAGLGFERDVYLEQEPGDREVPNEQRLHHPEYGLLRSRRSPPERLQLRARPRDGKKCGPGLPGMDPHQALG